MARKKIQREPPAGIVPRTSAAGLPTWLAVVTILVAVGLVYSRSLHAPFIFDDIDGIENNESIMSLWPLVGSAGQPGPLNPRSNLPSSGRPVVNLSLAVNYHCGGLRPLGYHLFNVMVHCGAALLLYAIVRRTLLLPYFAGRFNSSASWMALATSLLWALHPLQTEAVVYVTQRSELLMALFYLATLYCSLRYWASDDAGFNASPQRTKWLTLAIMASLAGMASKEVMVSAPLMILLFDRAFMSGTLGGALRRSWPLYAGLACTWLLLLTLNIGSPRGSSAGFGLGTSLTSWWMTQSQVLLMYFKLVVWPAPLLIHYRLPYLETVSQAWMYVVPVAGLLLVTLVLLWRNSPVGYPLAFVLVVLSPTSVVPIVTEMAAERRMYLPLAAIIVLVVVGSYQLASAVIKRHRASLEQPRLAIFLPMVALSLALGLISVNRLRAYQDETILWTEVVQRQPQNALAHGNLGSLYGKVARHTEAIDELQTAISLDPEDHTALTNLGLALTNVGKFDQAIHRLNAAIALQPDDPIALNNLGVALIQTGRYAEAVEPLERAIRIRPQLAMAHNSLGGAYTGVGKTAEAIEQYREALRLDPGLVMARQNLETLASPPAKATGLSL